MRSWWVHHLLLGAVLGAAVIIGFVLGYWFRGDVEAHAERVVAIEGESLPPAPCEPVWPVQSGDTLWQIASRCYPVKGVDVRPLVDELKAANPGVTAANLRAGQFLNIPEGWR